MSQDVGEAGAVEAMRATLAYNQVEDRISLTCALNNNQCVVLWLTARLASQLAPHLCNMAAELPGAPPAGGEEVVDNNAMAAEERESHPTAGTQDGSRSRALETPVVAAADSDSWMVTEIDITNGPMLVQLGFRNEKGHAPVLLSLEHTQLARWSEGLKHSFGLAGWPMDCWDMPASAGPQSHATRHVAVH